MIYKIISLDMGSTNSQMAITYGDSNDGGKTWKPVDPPDHEQKYLVWDNGSVNIPTVLFRKSDMTPQQKLSMGEMQKEYLAGMEAMSAFNKHYDLKLVSEFKKDFFCSEEAKTDPAVRKKYEDACTAIQQFLTFLRQREAMEQQKYVGAEEKTIVTVPVRSTATEREKMKQLAEAAGWKNIHIEDEARSVLRYALGRKNSVLIHELSRMTVLQDYYVLIMDIGGSTMDLLLVKIRPDGKGGFSDPDIIGQWPEVGEKDTLGGIDIDKKLCQWFLDKEFILPKLTQQAIDTHGYSDFRLFKEQNMDALRNGMEIPALIGPIASLQMSIKDHAFAKADYSASEQKMTQKLFLEEVAGEYLVKVQTAVRNLLQETKVREQDINCIITAGGGSRMYGIRELLLGELEIGKPFHFIKVQRDIRRLVDNDVEPSAMCALGNVLPLPYISFKNHALSDFVMKVKIYNVPLNTDENEWYSVHYERPVPSSGFQWVYYKSYDIIKYGDTLPKTVTIQESFAIKKRPKTHYVCLIEVYSRKNGKQYFQRATSSVSSRTPQTFFKDVFGVKHENLISGKFSIQVNMNEDYTMALYPTINLEGQWGAHGNQITING